MRDYEIVTDILNGNKDAYKVLMDRHYKYIYDKIFHMVYNSFDAEDLAMEAFEKVFENLDRYVPTHSFRSWLSSIAHNHCIDFIRKNKRKNLSLSNIDTETLLLYKMCPDMNIEEAIVKEDMIELLDFAVNSLKDSHREIIEKRYFEELSYEEITKALDIPMHTVKMRLFHAKVVLKEILKNKI